MAKNSRYKIFHENNADNKLSVLLSIQKYNPTYSELLKKVKLKADELKPILDELQKYDYIAIDINNCYMSKRPLPSTNDIKVYRYILRHNPKHSKMLRSINDIDARHITVALSKLQKEGLLYYDIKTERYSIIIKDDDVIGIIMDSIDTDEKIAGFVQRFREGMGEYSRWSRNTLKVFLSTFFDFNILHEHKADLASWFRKNGYDSLLDIYENKELYEQIVKRGKVHASPFWQIIDRYLAILREKNHGIGSSVIDALREDFENMEEEYIEAIIEQMPSFRSKDEFIKVLEQKLFKEYRYILTEKTSYIGDEGTGWHYHTLKKDLSKLYMLVNPENVLVDAYRDALADFKDYKSSNRGEDESVIFEQFCNDDISKNIDRYFRRNDYDSDTLLKLIYDKKRTYTGRLTPRMKECLRHLVKNQPDHEYTKLLKLIIPNALQ